jgi:hypothetical protein
MLRITDEQLAQAVIEAIQNPPTRGSFAAAVVAQAKKHASLEVEFERD